MWTPWTSTPTSAAPWPLSSSPASSTPVSRPSAQPVERPRMPVAGADVADTACPAAPPPATAAGMETAPAFLGVSTPTATATGQTPPTSTGASALPPSPSASASSSSSPIAALLSQNPYFSAGSGLLVLTAGLAVLRQAAVAAATVARRRAFVTIEIPGRDPAYPWVLRWLARHGHLGSRGHQLSLVTTVQRSGAGAGGLTPPVAAATASAASSAGASASAPHAAADARMAGPGGRLNAAFEFVPGPGRHYLRYDGAWLLVERTRERAAVTMAGAAGDGAGAGVLGRSGPVETVTLTGLSHHRGHIARLVQAARAEALEQLDDALVVYTSRGVNWEPFGPPRRRRPLGSVVLRQGQAERLVGDVQAFLASRAWYDDRGIPYRRGYLLHGPPGTGKTSFIQSLAGHLGLHVCILNLAERGMTDDRLAYLLAHVPPASVVVLEDVDAAFGTREDHPDGIAAAGSRGGSLMARHGAMPTVTFSGLLNALDGIVSGTDRLLFMTTNHVDRLDPALVRPGRIDVTECLGPVDAFQAARMFHRFYPDAPDDAVERFAAIVVPDRLSPAALQGHFVLFRHRWEAALRHAPQLCEAWRAAQADWAPAPSPSPAPVPAPAPAPTPTSTSRAPNE